MAETQDQRIEQMEEGRYAQLAYSYTSEFIRELREKVIARLITEARSGTLTPDKAMLGIGEMRSFDDLRNEVDSRVQRGQRAQMKERRNA